MPIHFSIYFLIFIFSHFHFIFLDFHLLILSLICFYLSSYLHAGPPRRARRRSQRGGADYLHAAATTDDRLISTIVHARRRYQLLQNAMASSYDNTPSLFRIEAISSPSFTIPVVISFGLNNNHYHTVFSPISVTDKWFKDTVIGLAFESSVLRYAISPA
jgi:hypothetical protein